MKAIRSAERTLQIVALLAVAMLAGGCAVLNPGPAPGRIEKGRDPDTKRDYLVYVPTAYHPDRAWPLVVACHASRLIDSPAYQIDEWKGLAEAKQFLVAALPLESTGGDLSSDPSRQLARLRADDAAILAVVAHVRAGHNIDPSFVFLAGWQGGAYPALYTGLRHPDVFRAIALRQPAFDARYVEPCVPFLDREQAVYVLTGLTDLTDLYRGPAKACVDWLRTQQMRVTVNESAAANKRQPGETYTFLRNVVRNQPWIRVSVVEVDSDRPLAVQFSLRSSVPIDAYAWDFGDGQTAKTAAPEHAYATAGTYIVRVAVTVGKKRFVRQIELRVPRARLGTTQPAGITD